MNLTAKKSFNRFRFTKLFRKVLVKTVALIKIILDKIFSLSTRISYAIFRSNFPLNYFKKNSFTPTFLICLVFLLSEQCFARHGTFCHTFEPQERHDETKRYSNVTFGVSVEHNNSSNEFLYKVHQYTRCSLLKT